MYQFKSWCFLCASEKNVDVEIQTLDDTLRETIGQFSLIVGFKYFHVNFSLLSIFTLFCFRTLHCKKFHQTFAESVMNFSRTMRSVRIDTQELS